MTNEPKDPKPKPTPRGPEEEPAGDRDDAPPPSKEPGPPPPPAADPRAPDANPIDPRVFARPGARAPLPSTKR